MRYGLMSTADHCYQCSFACQTSGYGTETGIRFLRPAMEIPLVDVARDPPIRHAPPLGILRSHRSHKHREVTS